MKKAIFYPKINYHRNFDQKLDKIDGLTTFQTPLFFYLFQKNEQFPQKTQKCPICCSDTQHMLLDEHGTQRRLICLNPYCWYPFLKTTDFREIIAEIDRKKEVGKGKEKPLDNSYNEPGITVEGSMVEIKHSVENSFPEIHENTGSFWRKCNGNGQNLIKWPKMA